MSTTDRIFYLCYYCAFAAIVTLSFLRWLRIMRNEIWGLSHWLVVALGSLSLSLWLGLIAWTLFFA